MGRRLSQIIGAPQLVPNIGEWAAVTPLQVDGFGTIAAPNLFWKEDGSDYLIRGRWQNGTTSAVPARLYLPNSALVGGQAGNAITTIVGDWYNDKNQANATKRGTIAAVSGQNYMTFTLSEYTSATGTTTPRNGSDVFSSGELTIVDIRVPIQGLSSMRAQGAGISATGPSLVPNYAESLGVSKALGAIAGTASVIVDHVRVGKKVTITLRAITAVTKDGSAGVITIAALDAGFRPAFQTAFNALAIINNARTSIAIVVSTAGTIQIYGNSAFATIPANQTTNYWDSAISLEFITS